VRSFDFRVPTALLQQLTDQPLLQPRQPHDTSDLKISTYSSDCFQHTFNTITSFAFDKDEIEDEQQFISTDASVATRTKRFCFQNSRSKIHTIIMRHTAQVYRKANMTR
jgi:hypothetical protein